MFGTHGKDPAVVGGRGGATPPLFSSGSCDRVTYPFRWERNLILFCCEVLVITRGLNHSSSQLTPRSFVGRVVTVVKTGTSGSGDVVAVYGE